MNRQKWTEGKSLRRTKEDLLCGKYGEGTRIHNTKDAHTAIHELFWFEKGKGWGIAYVMGSNKVLDEWWKEHFPEEIKDGLVKRVHIYSIAAKNRDDPDAGTGMLDNKFEENFSEWWELADVFLERRKNCNEHKYNLQGYCVTCEHPRPHPSDGLKFKENLEKEFKEKTRKTTIRGNTEDGLLVVILLLCMALSFVAGVSIP